MDGLPVTVRLLDPPLHEFLPDVEELLVTRGARASSTTEGAEAACTRPQLWREANPMLGTRGCRLGILKPEPLPHAGAGDHRGRGRRASRRAATRRSRS